MCELSVRKKCQTRIPVKCEKKKTLQRSKGIFCQMRSVKKINKYSIFTKYDES